ncbi:MAG: hypothetical protein H0V18_00770 [Pyrinomonadaceae bacterium]|nr:hypothetical protein [Pyrinomonadaceae bacterium]
MTDWGFENGHLEPWDFKHPGWLNERLAGHIDSPVKRFTGLRSAGLDA